MVYEIKEEHLVDFCTELISDQIIMLTGYKSLRFHSDRIGMVVCEDFENGTVYRFLSNNFLQLLSQNCIGKDGLLSCFKWIKQHLHIKMF